MAAPEEPIVRVRGLVNRFGRQTVHDGLDLDLRRGEILGVVGGSGSGKSVLLRSIIGLLTPAAGEIDVFGERVLGEEVIQNAELTRRWGVLFQGGALFSTLTVAENIEVPLRQYFRLSDRLIAEIAAYKLAMAGLPPDAGAKFPSELSGGMVKRAALARALALDPALLFLDEPTAGLDPIAADAFDTLLRTLAATLHLTVFLITHDLDTLQAVTTRVAAIAERRIIATGTIAELEGVEHPWLRQYFGGPRARAAARERAPGKAGRAPEKREGS